MSESAIKLFGKTIPLPLYHHIDLSSSSSSSTSTSTSSTAAAAANHSCFVPVIDDFPDNNSPSSLENKSGKEQEPQELTREPSGKEITDDKQEDCTTSNQTTEDSKDPTTTSSGINEKPDTETSPPLKSSSKNGEQSETSICQEKTLKKPDKILPCPRCNSMDTKFCYYNNYNVNQPRHFCKNCQRYWTAGGTMRNVPVGAGRRKNKSSSSSSSHYRHIMVSEALRTAQIQNPSLGNNTTVLSFGSDSPLCESVATVLNLSEKTTNNFRNGYHRPQADNGDDRLSGSSVIASNSSEKGSNCGLQELATKNYYQGFGSQVPCFSGPPWPYPVAAPAFCPSGFPVSFYPAPPYWGCTVPSPWNLQAQCISPTSPLGKHSREGNIINSAANSEDPLPRESNCTETNILVPKTLRIDDPSEAAKSSIWATLGIESKKSNLNGGGLFKGFQSKIEDRNYIADKSSVLQANPAAFSRSLNFHERT